MIEYSARKLKDILVDACLDINKLEELSDITVIKVNTTVIHPDHRDEQYQNFKKIVSCVFDFADSDNDSYFVLKKKNLDNLELQKNLKEFQRLNKINP